MKIRSKRSLEQLKVLISDGKIEEAADYLLIMTKEQSIRDQIYLLAGEWKETQLGYNTNLLNFSEYKTERNRIIWAFYENIFPNLQNDFNKERADQLMGAAHDKFNAEDFEGALVDFEAVLHLFPNDPEVLLHRGIIRNRLGRIKEALSDFDAIISREKHNVHALICRGSLFMAMNENEKAYADWSSAKEYVFEKDLKNALDELIRNFCSHLKKIKK